MQGIKYFININKKKLNKLQRNLISLSGISIFIMDIDGNFILTPIYISESCKIIQDINIGAERCKEEFLKLIKKVKQSKIPFLSSCYAGFCKFAVPIIVKEQISGILIGCQVRSSDDISEVKDRYSSLTKELGIKNKSSFLEAINNMPVISMEQLNKAFKSIGGIVKAFISEELELNHLTREIVKSYREITLLYEISEIFGSRALDVEKASQIILEHLLKVVEAERVSLMLIDKETNELRIAFAKGLSEEITENTRVKLGEGISGLVAKEGKPILVEDIEDNPHIKDLLINKDLIKSSSFLSLPLICAPLKIQERVIGVINLTNKKSGKRFTSDDLNLLSAISTQIAAVIENKRLFNDTKELFINTVKALSSALEAKDYYTHGHSQRVSRYSLAIANELNLSPEEKADIELAAFLHDIGKIGISEIVLLKPDKLTSDEFDEVKGHPGRGVQILGNIKQLSNILPGILHHHERFDGRGYPDGLKGDEVPQISKILSIADTFDAMLSERPYRLALSREATIEEITRNVGTQFDPVVCQAFLKACQKGSI